MMFADFFYCLKNLCVLNQTLKKWFMCSIIIWDEELKMVRREAGMCSMCAYVGGKRENEWVCWVVLVFHISARGFHLSGWVLNLAGTFVTGMQSQIDHTARGHKPGREISAAVDFMAKLNNMPGQEADNKVNRVQISFLGCWAQCDQQNNGEDQMGCDLQQLAWARASQGCPLNQCSKKQRKHPFAQKPVPRVLSHCVRKEKDPTFCSDKGCALEIGVFISSL